MGSGLPSGVATLSESSYAVVGPFGKSDWILHHIYFQMSQHKDCP